MGATVVKIEPGPDHGDDARRMAPVAGDSSAYFDTINPFKLSIGVDLKQKEGWQIAKQPVATADVFVENFRSGVAESLRLSWDDARQINPKIVYGSISAYGRNGTGSARSGYDALLQARTSLLSVTDHREHPPIRVGVSISVCEKCQRFLKER